MKKNKYKLHATSVGAGNFAVLAAFILSAESESVWANAFRLPNQDPEAIARGDAFTATADDPAAVYYNPAGITQLPGQQVSAGLYVISADTKFSAPGESAGTATTPQEVPQLYYVNTFTNVPLSVGFGVYAPYGLSLNWGANPPFSTAGENGSLLYACFNPVLAWKISKTLSVAMGPDFNYSQVTFNEGLLGTGYVFKYKGDGWDFGYNAGLLWQPDPKWSFGINYRSSTRVKYEGTASQDSPFSPISSTSSSIAIPFPEYITGGISFRPTPNWNFEFDLDWTKWNEDKQVTFDNSPFGTQTLKLNFNNSFIYEFGLTRELWDGYFASVGYMYSQNSSPSANFNPVIPDANLNLGGVGLGHHGQRWDWMAAFQFAYGGRTVSGDSANPSADGTYRTFNKAVNISGTYKF